MPQTARQNSNPHTHRTVCAVIPCFGRPDELAAILSDLARLTLPSGVVLHTVVVDNASPTPLHLPEGLPGINATLLRLDRNAGGSGGFNAAMRHALRERPTELLWLLDSDVRVEPSTLAKLLQTLDAHRYAWAVGPAIAEAVGATPHEIGGRVDAHRGTLGPAFTAAVDRPAVVDYVPSCCLLARAAVIRRHGLMPDVFLNGDDAEWCLQLSGKSGGVVLVDPAARAFHPRFDRYATWARFYQSRNAFGAIASKGLSRGTVFRRAWAEVRRAINQAMLGRDDLAELHIKGLKAAATGDRTGPRPEVTSAILKPGPLVDHRADSPKPTRSLPMRFLLGPNVGHATVDAKGGPDAWLCAHRLTLRDGASGVEVAVRWPRPIFRAGLISLRGLLHTARLWLQPPGPSELPMVEEDLAGTIRGDHGREEENGTLSIVVLSYNRRAALASTLRNLRGLAPAAGAELIVVDNASSDGSSELVLREFPGVQLIRLGQNIGVAGFNRGVAAARGELVLILDDDACPDAPSLSSAIDHLRMHRDCAAVALHPVHPRTAASEWPFARSINPGRTADAWPVMGAGNLVKREAWIEAGGYDERFFLYRNDTDLAMKLLALGHRVAFSPSWVVWHDSPAAARKSPRWCRLATRNWLWLTRRHARGATKLIGAVAGWAWAHRLAGFSLRRHANVLKGVWEGIAHRTPPLAPRVRPSGAAYASLLSLQLGTSRGGEPWMEIETLPGRPVFAGPGSAAITGHERDTTEAASVSSSARHSA